MDDVVYLWFCWNKHDQDSLRGTVAMDSLAIVSHFIASLRQIRCRLAHVQLPGHHVGDEARAVLAAEVGLPAGAADGGVDAGGGLVKVFDDGALFGEGREEDANTFDTRMG